MTDNETPRDAIENVIDNTARAMSRSTGYTSEEVWLDNPDECADSVIDYLWREAMKPEVIAAMAKALWVADDKPGVGHGSDGYHMEAEHHIRLVLNLILGPRPNGEEAEHG